jgi:DNA helicase HerA-like ATPase
MKVFTKEGDTVRLIALPTEEAEIGEYLCIDDHKGKQLIVQVIDIQYANIQGVFEDILRDGAVDGFLEGNDVDPLGVTGQISFIKDAKLILSKVRGIGSNSNYAPWGSFLPSRTVSRVNRLPLKELVHEPASAKAIKLGTSYKSEFTVDVRKLDGKLNIITGRKGTGKSHLSKTLLLGLLDNNAPCMILDINGEYVNLGLDANGEKNSYHRKVKALKPGINFKFRLSTVGLSSMLNVLSHALDLPWNSIRVFIQIWKHLKETGKLNLKGLGEEIKGWKCHDSIKEALGSRYTTLLNSGIFDDSEGDNIERITSFLRSGGAAIIDLKNQNSVNRRIIVELILSKLKDILYRKLLPAIFLFAEEAHLYLRETYWDDIVTRMRHLGLFATFITNQPDTVRENIYRQADNLFIFNFLNERDVDMVSRSAKIDSESVKSMVKALPPRHCLVLGDAVNNFPVVVEVKSLSVKTMGETRLFFARTH